MSSTRRPKTVTQATQETQTTEKYQLIWSMAATPSSGSTLGSAQPISPDGYIEAESPMEEEVVPIEENQVVEEPNATEEPNGMAYYSPLDEGHMRSFRSSPKFRRALVPPSISLTRNSLRIGGLVGWSMLSFAGALFVMTGPSAVLTVHLAEVGGVWAGVSAGLWFLPSKLM